MSVAAGRSALTHDAEDGVSARPMLMTKSGTRAWPSLAMYAEPYADVLAHMQA